MQPGLIASGCFFSAAWRLAIYEKACHLLHEDAPPLSLSFELTEGQCDFLMTAIDWREALESCRNDGTMATTSRVEVAASYQRIFSI